MITLTTPHAINTVIGGNTPANYDKLVLTPVNLDAFGDLASASIRLTSTSQPTLDPIQGFLLIQLGSNTLTVKMDNNVIIPRKVILSAPQVTAVRAIIRDAQNAMESGLVSLGIVAGTQSAGV